MIIVDLNNEKEIKFHVSNLKTVKNVSLFINLPNDVVKKYVGNIDLNKEEVTINLPKLKDTIKEKFETECYLEFEDFEERFFKNKPEAMLFQFSPIVKLKFNPLEKIEMETEVINKETINVVKKRVDYKKSNKLPNRTELISIDL